MQANSKAILSDTSASIPVLHCRGTHYEVGFQIGSTFRSMIQELIATWKYFNHVVLKLGSTPKGKSLTQASLQLCNAKFPEYVDEIRGMADGSEVEFEKLFMLNIDSILCTLKQQFLDSDEQEEAKKNWGAGCTTIICNKDEVILGHTEDAMTEIQNHIYIVSAEIISNKSNGNIVSGGNDNESVTLEKFTTLCYAGALMGFTMGYNNHGMVYSVNTIFPSVYTSGTPRAFVARSVLGAVDLSNLITILRDKGNGIADGFSLNVYFYPQMKNGMENGNSDSSLLFYNIEVAPPKSADLESAGEKMSVVDVHEIKSGTAFTHCNRYLRVRMDECNPTALKYSDKRNEVLYQHHEQLGSLDIVKAVLSDQTDCDYPIYNNGNQDNNGQEYKMSFIRTVAVGIFNINRRTWDVYDSAPTVSHPVHRFVF